MWIMLWINLLGCITKIVDRVTVDRIVGQAKVGESFKVKIMRNKIFMNVPITLEELPTEDKIASIGTKKIIADSISGISVKNLTPNEKNTFQVKSKFL